jgi:hypothetical protein
MHCRSVYKWFIYLLSLFSFVTAAVIQFHITSNLKDCDQQFSNPPLIAGGCLLGSVLFCFGWVYSKRSNSDSTRRICMMLWTIAIGTSLAAIGVSIGQINYSTDLLQCTGLLIDKNNLNALQYASEALIILSIMVPHVFSPAKGGAKGGAEQASSPAGEATDIDGSHEFERRWSEHQTPKNDLFGERDNFVVTKPLVFV